MGIYDRDDMHDGESSPTTIHIGRLLGRIGIAIFSLILVFFSLRFPVPIYVKIPILVAVGYVIRFLSTLPKEFEADQYLRQGILAERRQAYDLAIRNYEAAAARKPTSIYIRLRLLAAYHGADQSEKAQDLILTLDGALVLEKHVEEMEQLLAEYRTASFERVGSQSRITLAKAGPQNYP